MCIKPCMCVINTNISIMGNHVSVVLSCCFNYFNFICFTIKVKLNLIRNQLGH